MRIDVSKFGMVLVSRPAGHDAFLSVRAYNAPKNDTELIELDFSNVRALAPAWADEFVRGLQNEFAAFRVKIIEGDNLSVKTTFETLRAAV